MEVKVEKVKTYIINMKSAVSRREYMLDICSKYKNFLDIEFFEAINGHNLEDDVIYEKYNPQKSIKFIGRPLKKGEIGCILSHIEIYKRIIENNIKYALILEDDIILDDNLANEINSIFSYPKNWDVVLYGHYSYYLNNREIPSPVSIWNKYKREGNSTLYRLTGFGYGTHGYLISQNGAKKLLKELSEYYAPIDYYTSNTKKFNVFAILPTIIKVNTKFDSIINSEKKRSNLLKNVRCFWVLRNLILSFRNK